MPFLDLSALGVASSPSQLVSTWQAYMQAQYPGYVPSAGDLAFVQAQAIAAIASDVANAALVVPSAIFRQFGTQLAGIAYKQGLPAMASVQVTAVDTAGHTLPAGTAFTLGVYGFATLADLVITAGSSTGTVTVVANAPLAAYNGATNPTSLGSATTSVNWVSTVTALAPASGGVDPEDDTAYQNRLANQLQLQAPRPITASDYATFALAFQPATGTTQQAIGRATSIDGYLQAPAAFTVNENSTTTLTVTTPPSAGVTAAQGAYVSGSGIPAYSLTANTTSGSVTLSGIATGSFVGVAVGALISGAGIPANTTVVAFNSPAGTITMSLAATATATGVAVSVSTTLVVSSTATTIVLSTAATATATGAIVTVSGTTNNQRTVTTCVTLADGTATNTATKTALSAWIGTYREANFVAQVIDPTYTTVYVNVTVVASAGFDKSTLQTTLQNAIVAYLSPKNWRLPPYGNAQAWLNSPTVFYDNLVNAVYAGGGGGVDHVVTSQLTVGTSANPTSTTDLLLPGPCALPMSSTSTVTVTVQ